MKVRKLRRRFYAKTGGPRGIGNRCKAFCPGCIGCQSYMHFYITGRFPTFEEAHAETRKHAVRRIIELPWRYAIANEALWPSSEGLEAGE